ncbi:Saccharopine dehydrogenase [Clostridiales bacterium CHKCI001]|nr:Saccharopine dehydrogenase [Clostridiales bacterium CHKCI001]
MRKIFIGVIGSGGFIGRKLCKRLVKKYHVRGGQRKKTDIGIESNRFVWQYVDIYDEASLINFCSGCKIIINCAGPTYQIGDRIAIVANRIGADYIDIFGGGYLEKQLFKNCMKGENYKIFAAGSMPGFSGIALKWLINKFDSIKRINVYEGSFEKSGIAACEDIIWSSIKEFGLKDTYVEDGKYIREGLEEEKILVPGVPEPVYCQYYLTQEMQHLQKSYKLSDMKIYHMNSNRELVMMLSQACLEAVFSEEKIHNNALRICSLLNELADKRETWYAYIVEIEGMMDDRFYHKRLIIRAKESALINIGVLESVVDEVVRGKKEFGIKWAYDFVDVEKVMTKLLNEDIIRYYLSDVADESEEKIEEGEL